MSCVVSRVMCVVSCRCHVCRVTCVVFVVCWEESCHEGVVTGHGRVYGIVLVLRGPMSRTTDMNTDMSTEDRSVLCLCRVAGGFLSRSTRQTQVLMSKTRKPMRQRNIVTYGVFFCRVTKWYQSRDVEWEVWQEIKSSAVRSGQHSADLPTLVVIGYERFASQVSNSKRSELLV